MTKIWRKQEWEQQELFAKSPDYEKNPAFRSFVEDMFLENCHERSEAGNKPFVSSLDYFRENRQFVMDKFEKKQKEESNG